ncbi:hypothetical protein ABW21_db0202676 [Orbilia brochopaga]|nr:hypothetical protein ABW21_db0202676 [Drechslerella brochopaga]
MRFSKILSVASILTPVLCAALAAPAPDIKAGDIKKRDGASLSKEVVQKREWGANGICHVYTQGGGWDVYTWTDWYFHFDTWGSWDDDWGSGFLDNLRAKCGREILDWGFWYDQGTPPTWGHANFRIRVVYPNSDSGLPDCTRDAVRAASWAWGPIDPPGCDWPGWKWW